MISRLLLALFLLSSLQIFSQSNYKPGAAITTNGDTLRGFINYRGWFLNPESIEFKASMDAKAEHLTLENTVWFSVAGYGSYSGFEVPVSMNRLEFAALTVELDTAQILKAVFLKEILRGDKITVFSFQDKIKKRFYIQPAGSNLPIELKYGKTVRELQEIRHDIFKDQLRRVAIENNALTDEVERSIQSASYSEQDVIKIVRSVNTKQDVTISLNRNPGKRVGYFVNAGVNNHHLEYTGKSLITIDRLTPTGSDKFKDRVTNQSLAPVVAVGADFFTNPVTRKLLIRTELSAFKVKSETVSYSKDNDITNAEDENTYRLSVLNVSLSPQVIYNFYTTGALNFYAGAGVTFSILKASENKVEQKPINQGSSTVFVIENYIPIRSSFLTPVARAGVQFFGQLDCSVIWIAPIQYSASATSARSLKARQLIFSLGYLINRK